MTIECSHVLSGRRGPERPGLPLLGGYTGRILAQAGTRLSRLLDICDILSFTDFILPGSLLYIVCFKSKEHDRGVLYTAQKST
jgi:hypothetical protein